MSAEPLLSELPLMSADAPPALQNGTESDIGSLGTGTVGGASSSSGNSGPDLGKFATEILTDIEKAFGDATKAPKAPPPDHTQRNIAIGLVVAAIVVYWYRHHRK